MMRCKRWKTCGNAIGCAHGKAHAPREFCFGQQLCYDHKPYVDGGVLVFCVSDQEETVMAKKSKKSEVTAPVAEGETPSLRGEERLIRIDPKVLKPHSANPRTHINRESQAFQDLLESVRSSGVREHLQIRPIAGNGIDCRMCNQPIGKEPYHEVPSMARFGIMEFVHARCETPALKKTRQRIAEKWEKKHVEQRKGKKARGK